MSNVGQMETLGKLETNTTNVIMEIERLSHLKNNEVQPHKYGSLHFLLLLVQLTLGYLALVNNLKACSPIVFLHPSKSDKFWAWPLHKKTFKLHLGNKCLILGKPKSTSRTLSQLMKIYALHLRSRLRMRQYLYSSSIFTL